MGFRVSEFTPFGVYRRTIPLPLDVRGCMWDPRRVFSAGKSGKLEPGLRMIRVGIAFSRPFRVWGQGCSNFLEIAVGIVGVHRSPRGLEG